jgi:hypothetical protein
MTLLFFFLFKRKSKNPMDIIDLFVLMFNQLNETTQKKIDEL